MMVLAIPTAFWNILEGSFGGTQRPVPVGSGKFAPKPGSFLGVHTDDGFGKIPARA